MLKFLKHILSPHLFTLYFDGGDEKPAPTSQTVTQTSIPEYARPQVERMLGKTEALSNAPYQSYGGERIAGFNPMQQQTFQNVANMQPSQQLGIATQMAGQAGLGSLNAGRQYNQQATNPYATQAFMSPYIQNALNPQMQEAARQSGIQGQQQQGQAVQQGAFGGARSGIVEAERLKNLGTLQNQIYGTGMQNAFQNAQQAQQFGASLGLQGYGQAGQMAGQLGQLGQTQFGQQKDILNAQMGVGAQQQGMEQQRLSQQYQDFLNQRDYPMKMLAFQSDMMRGLPLSQQMRQEYAAPPSAISQVGGLGLAAYGMFGNPSGQGRAEGGEIREESSDYGPAGLAELAIQRTLGARQS